MAYCFDIVTIFPGLFEAPFNESILKRARDEGLLKTRVHNLRDYTLDKHRRVDDYPFGGGVGMVMNVEPIARAIQAVKADRPNAWTILMTPGGSRLDQKKVVELRTRGSLIIVCGRYEGVDERVGLHFVDEEISIGDYILSGGEIPALVVVESVARLIPGVLGDLNCINEESFSDALLEYPQYTRPQEYQGFKVPEVLVSGDHKKINDWQRVQALKKTAQRRPDLLNKLKLSEKDKVILEQLNIG